MSDRLRVPDWIRKFSCSGWTNVFQLVPNNESLYCTETLFGDWNGRVLLLAKDACPTSAVLGFVGKSRIAAFPLFNPAARVDIQAMEDGWRAFGANLGSDRP
jgi:hypothetical protein